MTRRKWWAALVLLLWLGGLGMLARRELFPDEEQRRAKAALLVDPVTYHYTVEEEGQLVGFASSQVDTSMLGVTLRISLLTLKPGDPDSTRASWSYIGQLSPRFRLNDFAVTRNAPGVRSGIIARGIGNSSLELRTRGRTRYRTDTVPFSNAAITPEVAPFVLALGRTVRPGDTRELEMFDRSSNTLQRVSVQIEAESLFVVPDSAALDTVTRRFMTARTDTVRAWRVKIPAEGGGVLWFDRAGRIVVHEIAPGVVMRRTAFELAFDNWRLSRGVRGVPADLAVPRRPGN